MRPMYPISSTEMMNDINELQEHIIRYIGYDESPHDDFIDKQGLIDIISDDIDDTGKEFTDASLHPSAGEPAYSYFYKRRLLNNISRRIHGR